MRSLRIRLTCFVALLAATTGLTAQRTVRTSAYPSADLAAQINAADAALGAGPGTIVVDSSGTATSQTHLSSGHALQLTVPTRWTFGVALSSDDTIHCTGQNAVMTLALPKDWVLFKGAKVHNVTVVGCWAKSDNPGNNNFFVDVVQSDHITMSHCHLTDLSGLQAKTSATNYETNSEEGSSHDIAITENDIDSPTRFAGQTRNYGVLLVGETRAQITHNTFHGMTHGVEYWGGDSNKNIHSKDAARWVRDVVIADNQCSDVGGSCYWGSMGQNIQYLRNKAQNCGDACLDIEGDANDLIEGNTVIDGNLGILMQNNHLEYRNNTVISTHASEPLIHLSNNAPGSKNNLDIYIHDNTFQCTDPQQIGHIEYQDVLNFVFSHNVLTNVMIHPYARNQQGTVISDNSFTFNLSNPTPFFAIDTSWEINGYSAKILNNTVLSNAPQPLGSECIHTEWADSHAPAEEFIQGNTCGGRYPFPIDLEMVSNGARTAGVTFHVSGNHFARNRIQRTDNSRTAQFDVH
jgi:hypothetical protein